MSGVDWGGGRYEDTAAELQPAAEVVVERAAIAVGERVVDVGCGTGNAALLAAARGGRVVGVDPAARLLEVARERALAEGLDATFERGDAATLPVGDGEADVVVSVFGVIFAPDPRAAAAELARVTAPGGRAVFSAWLPQGALSEMVRMVGETVRRVTGQPEPPPPFAWHERGALEALLAPHGFAVEVEEHPIAFTAASPREYVESQTDHPMAVATRPLLERAGEADALGERLLALFEQANEDPDAFRVTSRYVVVTARR